MSDNYITIIDYFLSNGQKTFSLDQVAKLRKNNRVSAKAAIHKLLRKKYIRSIAKGFYVIYSPSERASKMISPDMYIDALMRHQKTAYYVGLLSAANLYGASHNRPSSYHVVTASQIRLSKLLLGNMAVHSKIQFPNCCIVQKKGVYGYIHYSSPALTAYDLVKFERACGGIENVVLILSELEKSITMTDMKQLIKNRTEVAIIQRLGYLMEFLGSQKKSALLFPIVKRATTYIPLSQLLPKAGEKNMKWKVIVNSSLEFQNDT